MKPTENNRDQAYENADESIKKMYGSADSGIKLSSAFEKYNLHYSLYEEYAIIVGDVILGFYKTTDLPRLFQTELGLGADDAQRLTTDLLEFLSPVLKREEEELKLQKEPINNLVNTIEAEHPNRELVEIEKPRETEPIPEQTERIHGYGSYRSQYRYGEEPEKQENVLKAVDQSDLLKASQSNNTQPPQNGVLETDDTGSNKVPIKNLSPQE